MLGRSIILATALLLPSVAGAQWAITDDHGELRGKRIVDVGSVERRTKHAKLFDASGHMTFARDSTWLEFNGSVERCIDDFSFTRPSSLSGVPALILTDDQGVTYLATLDRDIGSLRVDVSVARTIRCPADFDHHH